MVATNEKSMMKLVRIPILRQLLVKNKCLYWHRAFSDINVLCCRQIHKTAIIGKISVYKHSFCYSNVPTIRTKELFVSTANRPLVGTLTSMGDVSDIFAIIKTLLN